MTIITTLLSELARVEIAPIVYELGISLVDILWCNIIVMCDVHLCSQYSGILTYLREYLSSR